MKLKLAYTMMITMRMEVIIVKINIHKKLTEVILRLSKINNWFLLMWKESKSMHLKRNRII